jgi:hypothetical protein
MRLILLLNGASVSLLSSTKLAILLASLVMVVVHPNATPATMWLPTLLQPPTTGKTTTPAMRHVSPASDIPLRLMSASTVICVVRPATTWPITARLALFLGLGLHSYTLPIPLTPPASILVLTASLPTRSHVPAIPVTKPAQHA